MPWHEGSASLPSESVSATAMEEHDQLETALRYQAKAVLRKRARALRNPIPRDAIPARSARSGATLERHPEVIAARTVALFHPIEGRNEVDLSALDQHL